MSNPDNQWCALVFVVTEHRVVIQAGYALHEMQTCVEPRLTSVKVRSKGERRVLGNNKRRP